MALLGMGNPLLDISADVGADLLEKYGLKAGDAVLAEEKHQPLFAELMSKEGVQYIAGGATQNTIRVAQWMLQEAGATSYMGCVGADASGEKLKEACAKDGVKALYMVDPETPTGECATLIVGIERSLCTNLNAANKYQISHTKEPDNWKVVESAKIVYSAGFFATVCPDAMKAVAEQKAADGGIYCVNISAPFLVQVPPFKAVFDSVLPFTDILFGNETEARAWSAVESWGTEDLEEIAKKLCAIPSKKERPRTVVITNGAEPAVVCIGGEVTKHPILALPKEKLVDTNGAGDSYVGGFLAGLVKGKTVPECCQAGAHAASIIVQHSGCTFPATPGYSF